MAHTNRLAGEKSPYLLQHQHNPVGWMPWGEEAFARAQAEDKPIFLSVGYSTCHWCHVMERESFENEDIAHYLNEHFVSIKVDREERPDVDRVYMTYVQATTGSGGWPMSVFLTPDLKPFFGGTYFPPEDRYGRAGFRTLLERISDSWSNDRADVVASGDNVVNALQQYTVTQAERGTIDWEDITSRAAKELLESHDKRRGGFGAAPKFPRAVVHNFLHHYHVAVGNSEVLDASTHTLRAMALGGINDQLGGGFHRYSVDEFWIVPHFEKMLYDQAQIAISYLQAYQLTHDEGFAQTARDILDYVRRDLTHEGDAFFSAEDADSLPTPDAGHKEEGAFYVWTQTELTEALGDGNSAVFSAFYNVRPEGNAPAQGDPHGEFKGQNILHRTRGLQSVAQSTGKSPDEIVSLLRTAHIRLLEIRNHRPRPHLDDKIIVSWNGLMISAFARAGAILNDSLYVQCAADAATFIQRELYDGKSETLQRHWRDGAAAVHGFAEDYAFLTRGLLDLFEAAGEWQWLEWAERLNESLYRNFWDEENAGYFSNRHDPRVLLRMKDDYDGAEPTASSIAAQNNIRLGWILDRNDLLERAELTLRAFAERVKTIPQSMPELLTAALMLEAAPIHVVIAGQKNSVDTQALLHEAWSTFNPHRIVLPLGDDSNGERIASHLPFTAGMNPAEGKPAAYVCREYACHQPVTTPDELRVLL
jgi:uncharacterized protein YyaL (SSP411 family)